jgi:hypothetical protein
VNSISIEIFYYDGKRFKFYTEAVKNLNNIHAMTAGEDNDICTIFYSTIGAVHIVKGPCQKTYYYRGDRSFKEESSIAIGISNKATNLIQQDFYLLVSDNTIIDIFDITTKKRIFHLYAP